MAILEITDQVFISNIIQNMKISQTCWWWSQSICHSKKNNKEIKIKNKKKQGKNILLFYLHDTLCFKWAFYCHVMRETCMQCPLWENWEYRQFQSSERNAMVIFFSASEVLKFTEIWFAVYLFMPSSLFNGADYFFKWKESGRIIKLIIKA